jgi:glycosyltransferase involved in cell wall biosynthesis
MLQTTLERVHRHTPGTTVVVVDDASTKPLASATFRFDQQVGIARAKNKCIELLIDAGCDELFLLDDDCYPIADGWTDLYVNHPEPHLCDLFKDPDHRGKPLTTPDTIYDDGRTVAYTHPRGCMLYLNRSVIEACGGERTIFGVGGREHVEYSLRINHTGLTTNAFQDAVGSSDYVYSIDEHDVDHPNSPRSVSTNDRAAALEHNDAILTEIRDTTTGYVEYRDQPNVAITTLLTSVPDP